MRYLSQLSRRFNTNVRPRGRPLDRTGEVVADAVAADVLLDVQRATADWTDGLQPRSPVGLSALHEILDGTEHIEEYQCREPLI